MRVLEGLVVLRMRPLLAYGCKRNGLCSFVEVDQMVDACIDCGH